MSAVSPSVEGAWRVQRIQHPLALPRSGRRLCQRTAACNVRHDSSEQGRVSGEHGCRPPDAPAAGSGRRAVLGGLCSAAGAALVLPTGSSEAASGSLDQLNVLRRRGEVAHSEEEWRRRLTPAQYGILRQAGTELPLKSPLNREKRAGTFCCAGCGAPLFNASTKFESGTGWPSFYDALPGAVDLVPDPSIPFLPRTEVRCHRCQGHIGHVFDDGPAPTGERYCMNGNAMLFQPAVA